MSAEKVRCKILPDLKAPKGLRMINYYDMNSISDAWRNKEKAVWTNVFAPFEIMQALDMPCLSMEEYSTACALIDLIFRKEQSDNKKLSSLSIDGVNKTFKVLSNDEYKKSKKEILDNLPIELTRYL